MASRPRPTRASPLRVALVTSSYNYIRDGVALTLNRLVEYLERNGVDVLVFAPVGPKPAFAHRGTLVPVPSIAIPGRREYRMALGLSRAARRRFDAFRPDIVHFAVPDFLGLHARRLARKRDIPIVASYHTRYETYLHYYGLGLLAQPLWWCLRAIFNSCRQVYVPSEAIAEQLRTDGVTAPLCRWGRGIDPERFTPAHRSPEWRAEHGIGQQEVVVLFVSRLVREKGLTTLAAVLRLLRARGLAHRAVIVGDGPERGRLETALPDAVFTGFLDGDALARAYASADIFLFPSATESFGSVTLEAMASGLPVICADAVGGRSLVSPGVTGFLAPPSDAAAFADRVERLASDAALRRQIGEAARERARTFSWDAEMARILGYYRALVANHGALRPTRSS